MHDMSHTAMQSGSSWHADRPMIGFLNMDVCLEWALWPWHGVMDAAAAYQVNVVSLIGQIIALPQDFDDQANVLYALADARRLNGLIIWKAGLVSSLSEQESNAFCRRFNLPVVTIEGELPGTPCVTYSNYVGMQRLMEHLIEVHGYQRIGFVGMLQHHAGFQARYQAYRDTLQARGLVIDPAWTQQWFPDEANLDGYIDKSLFHAYLCRALDARVEALVGVADTTAIQLLTSLRALNIRVPHEVAVVGFDGFTEGRAMTPPLTTVDPGWHQLGYQAMTTMVRVLAGEPVPPRVIVPGQVLIRQSCGCADAALTQAARRSVMALQGTTGQLLSAEVTQIAQEMRQAMRGEGLNLLAGAAGESLLRAFQRDLTSDSDGQFLFELEALIRASIEAGKDVSAWHDAISVLCERTAPAFITPDAMAQANKLWQQARVLIGNSAVRAEIARRLHAEQLAGQLREIGQALITAFDLTGIMDVLVNQLPRIGIPRCYVATFEQPQTYHYPAPAPEWARLRLAYDEGGRRALPPEGLRFPSWQLTPPDMLPTEALIHLVVLALYFKDEQIGFVLFEAGPRDGRIYETLRGQLSSALQGALLVKRVQERSAEIARQKYILDTFMANVPDSIYFKDCDSRILLVNQALANRFDLHDPAEAIGKTDFDFFREKDARPKYEMEQDIIRTGQPIFAQEEPDAGGTWSLTTKMPLRDEHGAIIGTFGISRDITELKNAQQALAHAYSEISVLNTQLQEENVRMGAELNVVKQLQQMILPRPEELAHIPGLEIAGYMQPADEVGGDYYDVLPRDGMLHIGIGDVTGHGLESGVIMLMTQAAIRTLIEHGETDPVKFVTTLNRLIYKNARRIGTDKNLTFALVQYQQGSFKLVGQHEDVLVVRQNGQVECVNTMYLGFPVGLEANIEQWVKSVMIILQSGDGIVLYTDGITEAENDTGERYGLGRLCNVISENWAMPVEMIKQAMVDDVFAHIGTQKVYDDITLVVLKQK